MANVAEVDPEELYEHLVINSVAPASLIQACVDLLEHAGKEGKDMGVFVEMTSSVVEYWGFADRAVSGRSVWA